MEIHWEQYRHSEFLQTLQEEYMQYISLFLKKSDKKPLNEQD